MNDREKLLAAVVGVSVLLWGAKNGWDKYQAALEYNQTTQRNVAQELSATRTATARGRRAQQKIRGWQRQSLPTDADIARSLYQDWLRQQLADVGLEIKELTLLSPKNRLADYQELPFKVVATGGLDQLTNFLHKFYQSRHLHRISKANLTRSADRKTLSISLNVDALRLADADRTDTLASGTGELLPQSLEDFRTSIVGRNLFAAYQAPKPPTEVATKVEESEDTEAAQAQFSSINYGRDGWLMSIRMQKSGKVHYYREGDQIAIGRFHGTIESLDGERRRAVVATKTKRVELRLGETLAEAQPLAKLNS